jgi:Sec-independent protein translocase protein TatA
MDSVLGIGLPELMVILLLAGLIMGPQRVRQVARTLGRLTAELQRTSRQFFRQLNAELDTLDKGELKAARRDLEELRQELRDLRQQVNNPGQAISKAVKAESGPPREPDPPARVVPDLTAPSTKNLPHLREIAGDPDE